MHLTHLRRGRAQRCHGLAAALALSGASLLSACAHEPAQPVVSAAAVETYVANYPPELQRLYRQVPLQGQRNLALNQMRAGLAALDMGRLEDAAASFDQALQVIEAIYADSPEAERARSVWYAEAAKDFKGEPYERAMVYYYRGIIYLMQGDYQNARAAFRGGMLQDSFMEDNQRMASDFGALAFLEGWAGRCASFDRSTVESSFREATTRNVALAEPSAGDTILAIIEPCLGSRRKTFIFRPPPAPVAGSMPSIRARWRIGIQPARQGKWQLV
jgi:tetratricopeptide (TPR) repeat protein